MRLVISADGKKIAENTVSVNSFNVALVWSTDTFVPGSYDAKALPSVGSRVAVAALPEIRNEKPEDLLYTWYLDAESRVRNVIGEQEFVFTITKNVTSVSIIVEVSNLSQSLSVRSAINIPVVRPTVALSPGAPVFTVPGARTTLRATPLYFHVASMNELLFEWGFGGQSTLGVPPDPHVLTLIIPKESGTGTQMLTLTATNQRVLGEDARAEVEINVL